eukprot:CAMPEP_0204315086 /NCGR_PEP_ID=MMETSP0469-20131031/4620_1 /ASSEMBLY_ACC=CAM_ASM_000384 /TAXON_ID=2969 /ORGANISM="Oxyrrhis marina" /LENGTH=74 /DNA_ID=CAMNT_0051295683 /DNA_START=148 /DNA_END=370 /DNA_ORIENTATION=-
MNPELLQQVDDRMQEALVESEMGEAGLGLFRDADSSSFLAWMWRRHPRWACRRPPASAPGWPAQGALTRPQYLA